MTLFKFIFQNKNDHMSQDNDSNLKNNTVNEDILENLQINKKENNMIKINIESCEAFNKKNESEKENFEIIKDKNKKNDQISTNKVFLNHNITKSSNEKSKKINDEGLYKNLELNNRDKTIFQSIGIYYIKNSSGKKLYFNILQRKITFQEVNKIDNFFFEDVTDLINYELNQHDENLKKQKVFAKISHEFKTPLNSIIGMIGIIKNSEKNLSESVNKYLQIISNLSNYVTYLVSDIIQFVNLKDLNHLKVIMSELNFEDILKFCFQTLQSLISCNQLKTEKIHSYLYYDQNIGEFIAESDENRLKQIILNFISNAVKFTREGSIYLKCKLKYLRDQYFIKISVIDTGIGIKEADKNTLFKDFGLIENEDKTINNNFGTGLGLSICKSLVEKLELKLEFQSKYLEGSKFSISVPCKRKGNNNFNLESPDIIIVNEKKRSEFDDSIRIINRSMNDVKYDEKIFHEQEIILRKSNEGPYEIKNNKSNLDIDKSYDTKLNKEILWNKKFKNLELEDYQKYLQDNTTKNFESDRNLIKIDLIKKNIIVLADDNHLINNCNQKIISDILIESQRHDFEIICVNDGADVLKIFLNNENTYILKLLITDENMDFLNGSDSIRVIRKIENSKNIRKLKIISLTCHEDYNIRDMITKAGADFILTKPLSKQTIKSLIEKNNLLL